MKKIIKLDEYLEKNKYNMVKAAAEALGIDPEEVLQLWKQRDEDVRAQAEADGENPQQASFNLERELLAALDVDSSNEEAADKAVEQVRSILAARDVDMWENAFNGVDSAGGYNLRFHAESESVKNKFMDWLEEQGEQYLINTSGQFAVRCEDKNRSYKISRQFEHFRNRWDRPARGTVVDPVARIHSINDYRKGKALEGEVVPFPKSPKQDMTSSEPPVPNRAYAAKNMNDEALFDFCYNVLFGMAVNGEGGGNLNDMIDQVEQEVGRELSPHRKANLKAKLIDELGDEQIQQFAWKRGTIKPKVIHSEALGEEEMEEAKNVGKKFLKKRGLTGDAEKDMKRPTNPVAQAAMFRPGAGAHTPKKYGKSDRKQGKIDTRKAMEGLVKDFVAEVAEKFNNDPRLMLPYMITFLRDSVEMSDTLAATIVNESIKKHHRIDERVAGVMGTGVTGLQSLGRMRELAGIRMDTEQCGDDGQTTVTVEPTQSQPAIPAPVVQTEPTQVQTSETHDLGTAIDTMKCALEVYKSLDRPSRKAFKAYVVDSLMGDFGDYTVQDGGQMMAILGGEA